MYRHNGGVVTAFDSVVAMEGRFKYKSLGDPEPDLEITVTYLDSKTGLTWGFLPVKTLFSPKTMEAFRAFRDAAEQDIGMAALGGGAIEPFGSMKSPTSTDQAESDEGPKLPPGLGEGG